LNYQNVMKTKKSSLSLAAVCFALAIASSLAQQPKSEGDFRPDPDRPRPERPEGFRPGGLGGPRGGGGASFEQFLTEDQRQSMAQAMMAEREKLREMADKIAAARKALMTMALTEDFNEAAVRAKALEIAKLESELMVIRLKALSEVQPPLSKSQLERILAAPQPGGFGQRPDPNRPPGGQRPPPPANPNE
jgi:Spy/CpxP family protein refolding chaperone